MLMSVEYRTGVNPYQVFIPMSYNSIAYQNKNRILNSNFVIDISEYICSYETIRILNQYKLYDKKSIKSHIGNIISLNF